MDFKCFGLSITIPRACSPNHCTFLILFRYFIWPMLHLSPEIGQLVGTGGIRKDIVVSVVLTIPLFSSGIDSTRANKRKQSLGC